jgi:hypothetical protein
MRRSSLIALFTAMSFIGGSAVAQTTSTAQEQKTESKKKKSTKKNQTATRDRKTEEAAQPEVRPGKGVTAPDHTRPGTPPTFPRTAPDKNAPVNPPDPTAPTTTKPPA